MKTVAARRTCTGEEGGEVYSTDRVDPAMFPAAFTAPLIAPLIAPLLVPATPGCHDRSPTS
jgi:hypothetical protein